MSTYLDTARRVIATEAEGLAALHELSRPPAAPDPDDLSAAAI